MLKKVKKQHILALNPEKTMKKSLKIRCERQNSAFFHENRAKVGNTWKRRAILKVGGKEEVKFEWKMT